MLPLLFALALAAPQPQAPSLEVSARWETPGLVVRLALSGGLPQPLERALPSGAVVRVLYPIRVRSRRRLWWDRRLFDGEAESLVAFDPVTGRYRCQLRLGEVIVSVRETTSAEVARAWLTHPPPIHLAVRGRPERVRVEARAVFATTTSWLVFPSVEGTPWVRTGVEGPR